MKKKPKYVRRMKKSTKLLWLLSVTAVLLTILVIIMFLCIPRNHDESVPKQTVPDFIATTFHDVELETIQIQTTADTTQTMVPSETTEPQLLSNMAELYGQNPDIVGWVKIENTKLDYPVMHTPNDPEKYLHLDFNEEYSLGGLPFVDANCCMSPESDNLLIYGHNMQNGTMFRALMSYDTITFWKEHPTISFSTLYEEREYEIIAAFYDRVYYKDEDCFKFYKFIDAEDETKFNEAMTYFKEHSLYDTGVSAEYGDNFITLVTCAYHVDNGRFVVVAKEITE